MTNLAWPRLGPANLRLGLFAFAGTSDPEGAQISPGQVLFKLKFRVD